MKTVVPLSLLWLPIIIIGCTHHYVRNAHDNDSTQLAMSISEQIESVMQEAKIVPTSIRPSNASPMLYEANTDDGLYLILVDTAHKEVVDILKNDQIAYLVDLIEENDSTGIEWQQHGNYFVSDSLLHVIVVEIRRKLYWEDSENIDTIFMQEKQYHYHMTSKAFIAISKDSVVLISN